MSDKLNKNEVSFFGDPILDTFFGPAFKYANKEVNMRTDIKENEDNYEFNIELPGVNKENIDINVDDGYLTISYKEERKNDEVYNGKYLRKERFFGNLSRSFYVGDIDLEKIEASYNNGVLDIIVPKEKEEKVAKKITIK